jgi:hypothetical protein
VKRGDTLVGIALQYGVDSRELAAWNNIVNSECAARGPGADRRRARRRAPRAAPGAPVTRRS